MTVSIISDSYEKGQDLIQLLVQFGVKNIYLITYNNVPSYKDAFLKEQNNIIKFIQITQQQYNNLIHDIFDVQQTNIELIDYKKLINSLIITIDYQITLDKSFKCTHGLIQLNFNDKKLIFFNPELHHETEIYQPIEMITFEDDYFYTHLYDKAKLTNKEIMIVNYEDNYCKPDGNQQKYYTNHSNQDFNSLDSKQWQQIVQLGNSLTEEESQIHKFKLNCSIDIKKDYHSGGYLSYKHINDQNFIGTISYVVQEHLYSFIALKVLIMQEAFQRSPIIVESYQLQLLEKCEQYEEQINNLTDEQRYKESSSSKIHFLLEDNTLDAGQEALFGYNKIQQLLQLKDACTINQLLDINDQMQEQSIPYLNESFTTIKTWISPGKSIQYNYKRRDESYYDVFGLRFQSCDVAYHPRQQDACFLKAFAIIQCLRTGMTSDFIPDLDGVFLQGLRQSSLEMQWKVFLVFAYFTHFFFKSEEKDEQMKRLLPLQYISQTMKKCFSDKEKLDFAEFPIKTLENLFTELKNSYKKSQGFSDDDVLKIINKHYNNVPSQDKSIKKNDIIPWDHLIYELAIARCNNFNIPYSASRMMSLTLKYNNLYINMAFIKLYKYLKMLPSELQVHVSDFYVEEWKNTPDNVDSRIFGEFNPHIDYLDIYYEENSLIDQKKNKKLKWYVDEDEIQTVGNIIDLILDKVGIQITFLTTLNGTLVYTDAVPDQKLNTKLQTLANNKYNLILISDNDDGEEFPNIRVWL